ncbi:hypothetical protein R3P38DRAFT_2952360 [Favolaschia claudopus]|uniref:F-box domain-containing protein n=1 Tax=Favolaschia claudopus TaxID=2862362 RepID=A0AAW0BGR4_9AGAR
MKEAPNEVVQEILTYILTYPDEDFSDTSNRSILRPVSSVSSYLLVCKRWLYALTPMLYHTVVLRTKAQAAALASALVSNDDMGNNIRKLRIEGGFGKPLYTILKSAPKITDLFLTLVMTGTEDSRGLCEGLALINPCKVILHDATDYDVYANPRKPKQNKQVTQLLEALCKQIPNWDKLQSFDFPYAPLNNYSPLFGFEADPLEPRAIMLAASLAKSSSIEYVDIRTSFRWPGYVDQIWTAPSFKQLRCRGFPYKVFRERETWRPGMMQLEPAPEKEVIEADDQFGIPIPFPIDQILAMNGIPAMNGPPPGFDSDSDSESDSAGDVGFARTSKSFLRRYCSLSSASVKNLHHTVADLASLKTLAASPAASTLLALHVNTPFDSRRTNLSPPTANPDVFASFPELLYLRWNISSKFPCKTAPAGFRAFENLTILDVDGHLNIAAASILNVLKPLDLPALRVLMLERSSAIPDWTTFMKKHGPKLTTLTAGIELLFKAQVFNLCPSLEDLTVLQLSPSVPPERRSIPPDFFTCSGTQAALKTVHVEFNRIDRQQFPKLEACFEALDPLKFTALKEIKIDAIQWPVAERELSKNKFVPLLEILEPKGIRLTDRNGGTSAVRKFKGAT